MIGDPARRRLVDSWYAVARLPMIVLFTLAIQLAAMPFLGFSLGWLRTKENFFISTPIDAVREMPERVQKLLGYETHGGIGVVDVGCPSALLART